MSQTSKQTSTLFGLAVFLVAGPALALPPGIYITDKQVDTSSPTFEKELKKEKKAAIAPEGGKWHMYFIAYLNKPAPADQLNIVFYDAKAKGKQEPNAYPISTKKGAKIVASEVTCSPEDSMKAGVYNVKITLLANGKEQVLATTKLEFK